jgi:hypothetical protein
MAIFTHDRIKPLLQAGSGPCVSIFMPTHRQHPGTAQDPIRFKNALKEAARLLSDRYSEKEIRSLLDPVAAMPSVEFWRHQGDGLAVFRSPDRLEHYQVPLAMPELVVVAESFHVRPVLRCLQSNLRYFVIALSQKSARVFEGTSASFAEVEIPEMPSGVSESAADKGRTGLLSAHPADSGGSTRKIHGAGGSEDSNRDDLVRYFRAIDRAIASALREEPAPLILAGVGYYFPVYRGISRLKNLTDGTVEGSPEAMTSEEMHAGSWPIAQAILRGNEDRALEEYGGAVEKGRSLDVLEDIAREAFRGRIQRLFLAQGVRVWGTLDHVTGQVQRTDMQQGSYDDDVLDDIAEAVLVHGGDVITLSPERMPAGREAVAQLRY